MHKKLQKLISDYSSDANIRNTTAYDIRDYIENRFTCELQDANNNYIDKTKQRFIQNLANWLKTNEVEVDFELNIWFVKIIRDEKSNTVYAARLTEWIGDQIFIIMDMSSGYFQSNSPLLMSELVEFRGISPNDITNKSLRYFGYLVNREQMDINEDIIVGPEEKKHSN